MLHARRVGAAEHDEVAGDDAGAAEGAVGDGGVARVGVGAVEHKDTRALV